MFTTFYVVKSTTTLPLISPSGRLRHIVKFATYTIVCCRQHTMVEISLSGSGEGPRVSNHPGLLDHPIAGTYIHMSDRNISTTARSLAPLISPTLLPLVLHLVGVKFFLFRELVFCFRDIFK